MLTNLCFRVTPVDPQHPSLRKTSRQRSYSKAMSYKALQATHERRVAAVYDSKNFPLMAGRVRVLWSAIAWAKQSMRHFTYRASYFFLPFLFLIGASFNNNTRLGFVVVFLRRENKLRRLLLFYYFYSKLIIFISKLMWRSFTRRRQRRRRHKDNKVSLGLKTTFEKREEKETQPYLEDIRPRTGGPGAWGDTADPPPRAQFRAFSERPYIT